MKTGEKIVRIALFVAVAVVVILGIAALAMREGRNASFSFPGVEVAGNCNIPSGASSGDYSVTVVSKKNYPAAVQAVKDLIQKYNGDLTVENAGEEYYPATKTSAGMTLLATSLNASVPMSSASAFMADLDAAASAAGYDLRGESYSKTPAAALVQTCIEARNNVAGAAAKERAYLKNVSEALRVSSLQNMATTSEGNQYQSAFDELNGKIDAAYNSIISANDTIASTYNSVNVLYVSITVQNNDTPQDNNSSSDY
jgi:hypothetical protein